MHDKLMTSLWDRHSRFWQRCSAAVKLCNGATLVPFGLTILTADQKLIEVVYNVELTIRPREGHRFDNACASEIGLLIA